MANDYTTISKEGIKYLCGLIRDLSSISDAIDDLHIRSDGCWSSVMIDTLIKKCLEDSNEYTDRLVANLSRLELKIATSESEITQPNIMYLYKPSGATNYEQYVVIEGTKVLLGTCDIDMENYYTIAQADAKFVLKTDFDSLKTKVDGKVDKTNIIAANDTSATDDQVYSAKAINTELDKVVKKSDIVNNLTSTDTDKPLSANQGKILDDRKLNKADVDKMKLTNVDNVNVKDFILENCTEENKTYYIIFRSNCTELPKKANYFVIAQKIGSFTIKVIAKELARNNNEYVCTYRSDDVRWTNWQKVCTTSVADVDKTELTWTDKTNYESSGTKCGYIVKNGICYVFIDITVNSPDPSGFVINDSGLPKPFSAVHASIPPYIKTVSETTTLTVAITIRSGLTAFIIYNGTVGFRYLHTFSYPVAES